MNLRSLLVLLTVSASLRIATASKSKYSTFQKRAVATAIGTAVISFSAISIKRSFREIEIIKELWAADTTAAKLDGDLPPIVIIKGVIGADDATGLSPATPTVNGLKSKLNVIDQIKNDWVEIAEAAKGGLIPKQLTDLVTQMTETKKGANDGISAGDIENVEDDFSTRTADFKGDENCVITEVVVARLCSTFQRKETIRKATPPAKEGETEQEKAQRYKVGQEVDYYEIDRPKRNQGYTVFQGRQVAAGLHILDQNGVKISLTLPVVHTIEPSSLFLPSANGIREFGEHIQRDGLTVNGKHHADVKRASRLDDPETFLSKFIHVDVQSDNELGKVGGSDSALQDLISFYGEKEVLFDPQCYYDRPEGNSVQHLDNKELPDYATQTQNVLVTPPELIRMAQKAAEENTQHTAYCYKAAHGNVKETRGPKRSELAQLRNAENTFRFTEHAIVRGSKVTVLGMPVRDAKTGSLSIVPPPRAESTDETRFFLRILKGHTVKNLLKQRKVNNLIYYGMAIVGAALIVMAMIPGKLDDEDM